MIGSGRSSLGKLLASAVLAVALIALLALLIRGYGLFARHAQLALTYPFNLNYGEGPLLDQSARMVRGEGIYGLTAPPFVIANYPPLYPLAVAPFVESFGPSYVYGRVISLISIGASAWLVGGLLHAVTHDRWSALLGGGLLLVIPWILFWAPLARIDSLALALSLAGLYLAVRATPRRGPLFPAALVLALAVYTRQTYLLAAPLAAFVWVARENGWARAWTLAVWLGVLVVGAFAVLLVWTQGGVWFHWITANANTLDGNILGHYIREAARNLPLFNLLLLIFAIAGVHARSWWLIAPYALGAGLAALTIAKVGSDVNYLYELSVALCLSAGGLLALARSAKRGRLAWTTALIALLVAQVWLATDLSARKYLAITAERVSKQAAARALYDDLRGRDELILADEAMGLLALAGQPIAFQPFEMSALARAGLWDERPFLERLASGAYPMLVIYNPSLNPSLRQERWTPAMMRLINAFYRPLNTMGETTVYWYARR